MRTFATAVTLVTLASAPLRADVVLWNNGPLVNVPGGGAGGAHLSRVQSELGLTSLGFGGTLSTPSSEVVVEFSDDFTVDTPGGWRLSAVTFYEVPYVVPSSDTWMSLQIFDAAPWAGGGAVFTSIESIARVPAGSYRVPGDDPMSTARPVSTRRVPVVRTLAPGQYWLVWQTAWSGGFKPQIPPVTIAGQRTTGDARVRYTFCDIVNGCMPGGWDEVRDQGTNAAQGFPFVITGRPVSARKGDFDGTYGPDLVFRNVNPQSADFNRNKVWFMDGAARAGEAFVTPDPDGPQWLVAGADDFDTAGAPANGPDGKTDLVFYDTASGAVQFWLMDGTVRLGLPLALTGASPLPLDWKLSATADFNGDGRPDIVWRNVVTQKIVVWTMNGSAKLGEITPTPDQAVDANWEIVAAQDYNADGFTDFLWYNATSGRIVTWYMNQAVQRITGQFVNPPAAGDNNWRVLAGGDYSGGAGPGLPPLHSPDIVWRNETSGRTVIWHLDNASNRVFGEFTSPNSNTPALDWTVAGPR